MQVRQKLRKAAGLVVQWARLLQDGYWIRMWNCSRVRWQHGYVGERNRSQQVTDACQKYGGFYLGSIGGPAAILAQNNIKSIECVEYPELGMEAIWKIEVENFPAFILVDDKGNDFFKQLKPWNCTK